MATKAIVGEKVGMTQVWDEYTQRVVPVTMVKVYLACVVVRVKTVEQEGYSALQVTYGVRLASKLNKPEAGISRRRASSRAFGWSSCAWTTRAAIRSARRSMPASSRQGTRSTSPP